MGSLSSIFHSLMGNSWGYGRYLQLVISSLILWVFYMVHCGILPCTAPWLCVLIVLLSQRVQFMRKYAAALVQKNPWECLYQTRYLHGDLICWMIILNTCSWWRLKPTWWSEEILRYNIGQSRNLSCWILCERIFCRWKRKNQLLVTFWNFPLEQKLWFITCFLQILYKPMASFRPLKNCKVNTDSII